MDCREAHDLLATGVDAPLPAATQRRLDAHLLVCPACVEALREHVLAREALRDAGLGSDEGASAAPPLDDALVRRIVGAMRVARAAPPAEDAKTA